MDRTVETRSWNRRRGAARAALAAFLFIGASGCAGDDEEPLDVGMAAAEVEADVCEPADLDFTASQACAGPWTYMVYEKQTSPFNLCSCQTYATCDRWVVQPNHTATVDRSIPGIDCHTEDTIPPKTVCEADPAGAKAACEAWVLSANGPRNFIDAPADQEATGWSVTATQITLTLGLSYTFRCDATIQWRKRITGPHPDCGCQTHASCGHARRAELTPTTRYASEIDTANLTKEVVTATGLTRAQVRAAHVIDVPGQITSTQIAPICSTAEDIPSGDYPAKLERLIRSLRNPLVTAAGTNVVNGLVRRAKVAFELFRNFDLSGWSYDPEPSDPQPPVEEVVEELYQSYPDIEPACGRNLQARRCQRLGPTQWRLALCSRLTSAHVGVATTLFGNLYRGDLLQRLYGECIQGLDDLIETPLCGGGGGPVGAEALDVHRRLHDKLLHRFAIRLAPHAAPASVSPPEITPAAIGYLAEALENIDRWYVQAARLVASPDLLRQELALAINKFWQAAHGFRVGADMVEWVPSSLYARLQEQVDLAASGPNPLQILETATGSAEKRGFRLDRAVLKAAYRNNAAQQPILTGAPLVRITVDALAPLVDRLEAMVEFHDVGCSLVDCTAMSQPSQVSTFWNVLAHLTAGSSASPNLASVLAGTSNPMSSWKEAFLALSGAQARLLDGLAVEGQERIDLLALVEQARSRSVAYADTGAFVPASGARLYTGVNAEQRDRVEQHLNGTVGLNAQLDAVLDDVDSRLPALVQGLVQVLDSSTAQSQIEAALQSLALELTDLRRREASFVRSVVDGVETDVFEALMDEWRQVEGVVDNQGQLVVDDSHQYLLAGDDARFDGTWDDETIDNVAPVGFQKMELDANQILSVAVSPGSVWSPTCALRDVRLAGKVGSRWMPGPGLDVTAAQAGPEGFTIGWSGSSYHARASRHQETDRVTVGNSLKACGSLSGSLYGLGGSAEACAYVDRSNSVEDSVSWERGTDSRTGIQLLGGLYVPTTPFEAPAGALVVVEMPRGVTDASQFRDIHFVRAPHTTIVVHQDADLWLVVNDNHCSGQDAQNPLEVRLTKLVTIGDAAEAMVKRMACTLALVKDRLEPLAARGEVLPSEIQEIERQAKFDLVIGEPAFTCDAAAGSPPIGFEQYPAPLQDMFLKYLAREIQRLEAAVRLVDLRRQIAIKVAEEIATASASADEELSGYLLALSPRWTARGMRMRELDAIVSTYAADMRRYLRPVIQVWYPDVLRGPASQPLRDAATDLANMTVDTGEIEMADLLREVGSLLALGIAGAQAPYPTPAETAPAFVTLRFPRPALLEATCAENPAARCRRSGQSSTFRWATVAQTRALWEDQLGLEDGAAGTDRRLTFQLSPDDLYQRLAGSSYLSCSKSLPVVRRIGLALTGFSSSQLPSDQRYVDAVIPQPAFMSFPGTGGVIGLELDNTSWLQLASVPLVYGTNNYNAVETAFTTIPQDVRGVSPFTTFVVEIPEATVQEWNMRSAATIDVVLELEATRGAARVEVPACSEPGP